MGRRQRIFWQQLVFVLLVVCASPSARGTKGTIGGTIKVWPVTTDVEPIISSLKKIKDTLSAEAIKHRLGQKITDPSPDNMISDLVLMIRKASKSSPSPQLDFLRLTEGILPKENAFFVQATIAAQVAPRIVAPIFGIKFIVTKPHEVALSAAKIVMHNEFQTIRGVDTSNGQLRYFKQIISLDLHSWIKKMLGLKDRIDDFPLEALNQAVAIAEKVSKGPKVPKVFKEGIGEDRGMDSDILEKTKVRIFVNRMVPEISDALKRFETSKEIKLIPIHSNAAIIPTTSISASKGSSLTPPTRVPHLPIPIWNPSPKGRKRPF